MTTTSSAFAALPDDVLQRVLLGVLLDDHPATAAACHDISARTWRLGAPLPEAQRGACGVVVDGKLYLVSTRLSVRRSTLVYDVQSNTWDQQIPPPYAPAEDLHAMYAFTHNGRIVVVYANGTAFHRGSGSDPDWYPFDLGVTSGPDHGVAGSIILG